MEIVIVGAGANTGAIIELIEDYQIDRTIKIMGISDIKENLGKEIFGYKVQYTDEMLEGISKKSSSKYAVISYSQRMDIKEKLYLKYKKIGFKYTVIKANNSIVSKKSQIGKGSVIMPGAIIRNDVIIGENCLINTGAILEHGVQIGNSCHIAPGAVLTGNVNIGDRVIIGANSTILPNIRVKSDSVLGAGSVLTKNLSNNSIAYGNPGKLIRRDQ